MEILPFNKSDLCREGRLKGVSKDIISDRLGFKPNIEDDPCKVVYSWGFTVNGVHCGIWDYKNSYLYGEFSTYGPKHIFVELFGKDHVKE